MVRNAIRAAALALALIGAPAAADYEAGQRAWDAGRIAEALSGWRAAAEAGDRRSMLALGRRYAQGLGILQDLVKAHKWLNFAASLGAAAAVAERDALAAIMTPQEVVAAREQAAAWRPVPIRFRDCDECPELVVVPAGSFEMGSPQSRARRYNNEGPVHRVEIGHPFAVGVYEVMRGEYSRFVSATGYSSADSCLTLEGGKVALRSGRDWRNPGFRQTDKHPAVCVSWEDAKAYVRWLSEKTGKAYRLLSESEWEYAARAGTRTPFHTGGTISTKQANYREIYTYEFERKGWYREGTVAVGSFGANGFGLHDVHGNVREWVEDCWNDSYRGAPADGSAWGFGNCSDRVLRGGSWGSDPKSLRSANRSRSVTGFRSIVAGFRVARTLTP